jgi:hypothetical protein
MIRSPAIKKKGYHGTVIAFKRHVARLRGWVAWLGCVAGPLDMFWHSPHPGGAQQSRAPSVGTLS